MCAFCFLHMTVSLIPYSDLRTLKKVAQLEKLANRHDHQLNSEIPKLWAEVRASLANKKLKLKSFAAFLSFLPNTKLLCVLRFYLFLCASTPLLLLLPSLPLPSPFVTAHVRNHHMYADGQPPPQRCPLVWPFVEVRARRAKAAGVGGPVPRAVRGQHERLRERSA